MKKGSNIRFFGMLMAIMLWLFSIGISTLHHHTSAHLTSSTQQEKQTAQHAHDCHHHDSDQDCGICFLIHNSSPLNLSYFTLCFALLYPATLRKEVQIYLLSWKQDHHLGVLSLRGPPAY